MNHRDSKPSYDKKIWEETHKRREDNILEGSQTHESEQNQNIGESKCGDTSGSDKNKKAMKQKVELQGEFKKMKPPSYDGEAEGEGKYWFVNMKKYFQVYEYDENLKARLAIYQLQGKATLQWEEVKVVYDINGKLVTREKFQKHLKGKYLTEQFYDDEAKEFHELGLGQLTMDEYVEIMTSLLWYVLYIREEKSKFQSFISILPIHMK